MEIGTSPSWLANVDLYGLEAALQGRALAALAPGRGFLGRSFHQILAHHAGERGVPFGRDLADFLHQIVLQRERDVHIPIIREARIKGKCRAAPRTPFAPCLFPFAHYPVLARGPIRKQEFVSS